MTKRGCLSGRWPPYSAFLPFFGLATDRTEIDPDYAPTVATISVLRPTAARSAEQRPKRLSNFRLNQYPDFARLPAGAYNAFINPETLAQELDRDPFIPLRIHLADGRNIDIRNPGLCFIARLSLYIFAAKPHKALAQDVEVVSLRGIVSVETLAPSEAA